MQWAMKSVCMVRRIPIANLLQDVEEASEDILEGLIFFDLPLTV